MAAGPVPTNYPMASLYVGDLPDNATEAMLFDKFSTAGPVLSIRVCRDMITRRSLGYAYVNFQNPEDAERAIETMNFDVLQDKAMRIMWSQRDPSLRRSGVGNIFIKNLDPSIDNKAMFDTFSAFGTIMSCKVATDDKGKSKGYGFVHFETEAAAMNAIDKVNGMALNQKKVFVGKFIPRTERARELGDKAKVFSNVYIKNFDDEMTEEKLYEVFSKYGEVTSHKVAFSDDGKNKGFGFVAFKDSDSAEQAVQDLNNSDWNGKTMYVGRAQKKSERMAELKKKFDALKQDRMSRNAGVNLYIKNLDDSIDDERLRSEFNPYGTITSAKVMTDEGQRSRGFGFVCFNLPDEATRAVTEMNGRILVSKPLYVALAQRREDRKAQLASQYMDRVAKMRVQGGAAGMPALFPAGNANYYMPTVAHGNAPNRFYSPAQAIPMRANTRWAQPGGMRAQPFMQASSGGFRAGGPSGPRPAQHMAGARTASPGVARPQMQAQNVPLLMHQQQQTGVRPNLAALQSAQMQQNNLQRVAGFPNVALPQTAQQLNTASNYKFTNSVRNPANSAAPNVAAVVPAAGAPVAVGPAGTQASQSSTAVHVPGQEPLTPSMLAVAPPQEQKQMLGERLYPLVRDYNPGLCGKITGMLLEMDNSDLLAMLDDKASLKEKMDEALSVLQAHQAKARTE